MEYLWSTRQSRSHELCYRCIHNLLYCATGLILLLWHYKELQTYNSCTFMAKKAICQKSYSLDWMHAKIKNLIEGCSYCLHVCLCKGKCAIIYVFCRSPNDLIEEKKRLHTYNVYIMTNGRCFQINYVIFHHFFVMERYNARHLSICSQHLTFF